MNKTQKTRHTHLAGEPETSQREEKISHSFQAATTSVCSVEEITLPPVVRDDNHHPQMPLLLVQVFSLNNMHQAPHAHLLIIRNHLPHDQNQHCM